MEFLQLFFVGHIILAFVAGSVASSKGRSSVRYFLLSLIFSFFVAILVLLAVPAVKAVSTEETRECPFCAEQVLARARVCKHCAKEIVPIEAKEVPREVQQHWLATFGILMLLVSVVMVGVWFVELPTWANKVYDTQLQFANYLMLAIEILVFAGSIVAIVFGRKITKQLERNLLTPKSDSSN